MSEIEISQSFGEKLVKAGVIPNTALSFRITAEVGHPVKISITHYATVRECDLIEKTLGEVIKENRND